MPDALHATITAGIEAEKGSTNNKWLGMLARPPLLERLAKTKEARSLWGRCL